MVFLDILLLPFRLFIESPGLTLIPVLIYAIMWAMGRYNALLLVTSLVWLAYGVYESWMCSSTKAAIAPIRVDLVLIAPLLYIISIIAFVHFFVIRKRRE